MSACSRMRRAQPSVSEIPIAIGTKMTFLPAMLVSAWAPAPVPTRAQAPISAPAAMVRSLLASPFIVSSLVAAA